MYSCHQMAQSTPRRAMARVGSPLAGIRTPAAAHAPRAPRRPSSSGVRGRAPASHPDRMAPPSSCTIWRRLSGLADNNPEQTRVSAAESSAHDESNSVLRADCIQQQLLEVKAGPRHAGKRLASSTCAVPQTWRTVAALSALVWRPLQQRLPPQPSRRAAPTSASACRRAPPQRQGLPWQRSTLSDCGPSSPTCRGTFMV
jgi:hypothetical protein